MNKRQTICAYCGRRARASTEHAMAKWIGPLAATHVLVTPAMRRHKWGGVATVRDVCKACNNGPLSVLDNVTKTFVKRGISVPLQLTDAESMLLGRWAGKVAYNMQRVCIREGTQGEEPQFPKSAIAWILGTGKSDEIRVAASWVPVSEAVRENFGVFASNGTFLPRRYVQAGPLVMFVAWAHPQLPESTLIVHEKDCKRVPAVAISHPSKPTIELPSMADTSMLLKGLAHMRDIAAELLKRLDSLAP